MVTENHEKKLERNLRKILDLLKDMDMKLNHIIERLKSTYSYLNSLNSAINNK